MLTLLSDKSFFATHRDRKARCRRYQRLRDAADDNVDAAGAYGRDVVKRPDDAQDGSE